MTAPTKTPTPAKGATSAKTRSRRGTGVTLRTRSTVIPQHTPEQAPETTTQPATTARRGGRTGRTSAADRAYARRAQRVELLQREHESAVKPVKQRSKLRLSWPRSRASFVLVMMGLLAVGVAATLWLSTQAIADSYRLEQLRGFNAHHAERAQQLQRQVTQQESASELARKAKSLGMVPGGDPARILVKSDGSTILVGEPKKSHGGGPARPPALAPAPGTQPAAGVPIEGDQPAVPVEGGR